MLTYGPRRRSFRGLAACAAGLAALVSCSEKATPEVAPSATSEQGALVEPSAPAPTPAPVDRSPIPVTERKERLALHATKYEKEVMVDEYRVMWMEDHPLAVHPLRNGMAASYAGYVYWLSDHRLVSAGSIFPEEAYTFTSITGSWPKEVYALVDFDSWKSPGFQRSAPVKETQHMTLDAKGWRPWSGGAGRKVVSWRNGSMLALQSHGLNVAIGDEKVPRQTPPSDVAACKGAAVEVEVEDLDAFSTGEAFVIGKRCSTGAYAVERWTAVGSESILEALPDAPSSAKRAFLSAAAPDRAYAVLTTGERVYAARWDGKAFRKVELAAEGDVRAIWATGDGAVFLLLRTKAATPKAGMTELLRVTAGAEVARSAPFAASPASRVWAADADTAYVGSYGSLLSTKPGLSFVPPEKPADAPKPAKTATAPAAPPPSTFPPYTDACTTPLVFLYDVSDKAPPGYDFPTTRKALSSFSKVGDLSLLEFVHGSLRRLGVKVPSGAVGKELVDHVRETMPDERPVLVCLDPKDGVRSIKVP